MKKNRSSQLKARISCLVLRVRTLRIWLHATHQEADTRMIWHAGDAVQEGYRKIVLRKVDTDVLVLAIAFAGILQEQQVQQVEVWIAMGTGSHFRCIAAGWIFKEGEWQSFWTTLPDVTKSCKEILRCGCKRGCRGGCSCTRVTLKCAALCSCNDQCNNR